MLEDSPVVRVYIVKFRNPSEIAESSPTCSTSRCFNEESCLSLKQLEGYLVVLQPDAPQISLSGVGPHLARPAPEFEGPRGVPLFPELRIVCSLSHAVNTAAQGMEGGGKSNIKSPPVPCLEGLIKTCRPCLLHYCFSSVT